MATTVPEKAALVVVDMQNDYCNARGVYPRNGLNCFDMDSVVPATVAAVSACKAQAIPVIYLRMAWNTDARGFPIDAGLIFETCKGRRHGVLMVAGKVIDHRSLFTKGRET